MRTRKLDNEKILLNGIIIIGHDLTYHAPSLIAMFKGYKEKIFSREDYPELQCTMNSCRLFRDLK